MKTMKVPPQMAAHGYPLTGVIPVFFVVVLGSTLLLFVALRIAAGTAPTMATTTSAFVLFARPPGLFNSPLPYSTFALFTIFFSLLWRGAPQNFGVLSLGLWVLIASDAFARALPMWLLGCELVLMY